MAAEHGQSGGAVRSADVPHAQKEGAVTVVMASIPKTDDGTRLRQILVSAAMSAGGGEASRERTPGGRRTVAGLPLQAGCDAAAMGAPYGATPGTSRVTDLVTCTCQ